MANSTNTVAIPPFQAQLRITDGQGKITPEAHKSLLQLFNASPLVTLSTAGGAETFLVPLARFNQNVEITYMKISADGNVPTLKASGNDKLNAPASWAATAYAMGAAQGSKTKLKSDGVGNWYVVG